MLDKYHTVDIIRRIYWMLGPNGARRKLGWPFKEDIRDDDWDPIDEVSEEDYIPDSDTQVQARTASYIKRDGNDY